MRYEDAVEKYEMRWDNNPNRVTSLWRKGDRFEVYTRGLDSDVDFDKMIEKGFEKVRVTTISSTTTSRGIGGTTVSRT